MSEDNEIAYLKVQEKYEKMKGGRFNLIFVIKQFQYCMTQPVMMNSVCLR